MSEPTEIDKARADGYNRQVKITKYDDAGELFALIKEDTNIDGVFKAFDTDSECMVAIDGNKSEILEIG